MEKKVSEVFKGKGFKERLEIYRMIVDGEYRLIDPNPPGDFIQYLMRIDYTAWFWIVMFWTLITAILAFLDDNPLVVYLKYFFVSVYVLFIIGYVTLKSMPSFTEKLTDLEELGLSIGLSLVILPLIALFLDISGIGIRLPGIVASTSIYVITVSFVAAYYNYQVTFEGRK